ncbi:MAG: RadC family protein [Bacteroidota bacterium]
MEDQKIQTFNSNLVSEIQLSYSLEVKPHERPKVNSGSDAYRIFKENWDPNSIELREEFKILLLNRANRVLGIFTVSSGGVSSTVVDPKLIFATALAANASAIILAHNHPSGNLKPSHLDIQITRKLVNGGKLLDISIYDHLIITYDGYTSFSEEGIL